MTIADFLIEFQDLLQRDDAVSQQDILAEIEEWDSMAMMASMAWFDMKLGIKLPYKTFLGLKTVGDIIALTEGKVA